MTIPSFQIVRPFRLGWRSERGQYMPISAMIMFTLVVMMVAMVNVYKVSRAKLKIQNIADAAALNLATQQAQAFNVVADRNEWLNHMVEGIPSPSESNAAGFADCSAFTAARKALVPGVSCVENAGGSKNRHIFNTEQGAANYASIVQTINEAQSLFVSAYNSFLGDRSRMASSAGVTGGPSNFSGLLKNDIPDLKDPAISLQAWNAAGAEPQYDDMEKMPDGIQANMQGLQFKPHHDIATAFFKKRCLGKLCVGDAYVQKTTLGELMFGKGSGKAVGWMIPDWNNSPKISVQTKNGISNQVGVGVLVKKDVQIRGVGTIAVSARSKAYVVSSSGESGESGNVPRFKPTYWSKLAN
jgi:hypothetical protein